MKILYVTNMYPDTNSTFGIFVKEQIADITDKLHCEYDIYYINGKEKGIIQYIISILSIPLRVMKNRYDIIHIHYGISGLFLFFYKPKAKIFITLHGSDILKKGGKKYQVYFTNKVLKKADKVFILSKEMEKTVKRLMVNYEILPCGVNTNFFKPQIDIKKDENVKLIIFPGNPEVKVKNYTLFTKVIDYLTKKSSFKIEQRPINDLSRNGVRNLLNLGDCILMTSISEGSSQVIKEALSCGLPVVSVPVGDVKFMTKDIPYCYVSQTYDAKELGNLVLKSFNDKGEIIRNSFLNKNIYDNHSITKRIIENYKVSLKNGFNSELFLPQHNENLD